MKVGLPLMKNVLTSLAKNVLLPLGVTAATSATDLSIQKKIYRYGLTTLIFSNEEINDIMKIVKSLEESSLLIKGVIDKKMDFLACYQAYQYLVYQEICLQAKELFKLVMEQLEQDSILMSPHPFNNFEVQKHYQNEPGVY